MRVIMEHNFGGAKLRGHCVTVTSFGMIVIGVPKIRKAQLIDECVNAFNFTVFHLKLPDAFTTSSADQDF